MKKYSLFFLILILVLGCEKVDKTCNCKNLVNPVEELTWLKELKASFTNCTCQESIIQASYNKQTVFYSIMNDPLCDGVQNIILLDCAGDTLKTYTALNQSFYSEVTNQKEIYTCKAK